MGVHGVPVDTDQFPSTVGASTFIMSLGQKVVQLADGTMIIAERKSSPTGVLYFWYSTDGGATWTECSTSYTGPTNIQHTIITTDPAEQYLWVFIGRGSSGAPRVARFTWSGTDVTLDGAYDAAQSAASYSAPGGMFITEKPNDSSQWSCVYTYSDAGSKVLFQADDWEKAAAPTPTWNNYANLYNASFNGMTPLVYAHDGVNVYQPTSNEAFLGIITATASIFDVRRIYWTGTVWTYDSSAGRQPASGWGSMNGWAGAFYNPDDGYLYFIAHKAATVGAEWVFVARQTPASWATQWSKVGTSPNTPVSLRNDFRGFSYDLANQTFKLWTSDSSSGKTIYSCEFDAGAGTWAGSWTTEYTHATYGFLVHGANMYGKMGSLFSSTEAPIYQLNWTGDSWAGGGAFVGWGIPMGIA